MNDVLTQECQEMLAERASFYRLLSSLYFHEVDDEILERLNALCIDTSELDEDMAEGFRKLSRYLSLRGPDARTDLAVDFARAFLAAGTYEGEAACPYESIYTSEEGLIMQEARDEVCAIYMSQGVDVSSEVHEPEDHVSFEFDFMAIMADRAADVLAAGDASLCGRLLLVSREFAENHLLNWFDAWGQRIASCTEQPFYPALFEITRAYVRDDVLLLADMEHVLALGDVKGACESAAAKG